MVVLAGVLCLCALFGGSHGSAIPMWEYLSKQEKTSYIYSMFANQVEKFCEGSTILYCNRQLLKYGLGTLKNMEEEQLDAMDPYQRGANNIIWEALMQGHRFQKTTTSKPKTRSTTGKPNSYEDESFSDSDYDEFGAQSAASVRSDNIYILPPPKDFILKVDSEKAADREDYLQNSGPNINAILKKLDGILKKPDDILKKPDGILKKPDGKGVFTRFQNQYRPIDITTEKVAVSTEKPLQNREDDFKNIPLTGRMVVRVYPDGTPVRESTQVPQDDDLKQYKLQHVKIPNF